MKRFLARFRTLQWKLTFSYTWVTTAVALAVFLILILAAASLIGFAIPTVATAIQPLLRPTGPQIAPFLEQSPPDLAGLRAWLDSSQQGNEFQLQTVSSNGSGTVRFNELSFAAVIDPQRNLLAFEPGNDLTQSVEALLFADALPALEQAMQGETDPDKVTAVHEATNDIFIAVPVLGDEKQAAIHGALHGRYKPDDNARDRAVALARQKYAAANHAAESLVIYPLQRTGAPGLTSSASE